MKLVDPAEYDDATEGERRNAAIRATVMNVDCIGLALDLEARAKTVESQTTERVMLAAAHGLRLIAGSQS
jgi:hypothetical protein